MVDLCRCSRTYDLKVEADIAADAIWCNKCQANFYMEDVPISSRLKAELTEWIRQYGEWFDWENDGIVPMEYNLKKGIIKRA